MTESNKITLILTGALVIIVLAVFIYLLLENSRMKEVIINKTLHQMEEDYKALNELEKMEFTAMEDSILNALSTLGTVSSYNSKVQAAYNNILEIIKESISKRGILPVDIEAVMKEKRDKYAQDH
ncbi:MAG: hypothetical protein JXR48_06215 [Candidatus Delongbacteria bacterium]|nr:hypothetical protein [Candidatus Delongbacteria bacterium]